MTVDGLPLHPLVVHAVVVLLPLSAVGTVLIAVRPAWRRRFGAAVAALTVLAVATVPVAQQTGDQLHDKLKSLDNPLIERHAELGETLLPYVVVFGVLVLALVFTGWLSDRRARVAEAPRRGLWQVLVVALAVLAVLSAAATTARVVQIGHSGSTAVWEGVANLP